MTAELPQPRDRGFNHSLGAENNASPSHRNPTNFVRSGKAVGKMEGYSCQIVADEIIDWLANKRDKSKPFFACARFHETHAPIRSMASSMWSARQGGRVLALEAQESETMRRA